MGLHFKICPSTFHLQPPNNQSTFCQKYHPLSQASKGQTQVSKRPAVTTFYPWTMTIPCLLLKHKRRTTLSLKPDKPNYSISLLTYIIQIKAIPTSNSSPPINHLNQSKCPHLAQAASLRSPRSCPTKRLELPLLARLTPERPRPDPKMRAMRQRKTPCRAILLDQWRMPLTKRSARRGVERTSRWEMLRKRDGHEI